MRAALLVHAQVFEQQGVIQFRRNLQLIQFQLFGDLEPDPAAAQAVPLRLALGNVQGMAEGAEKLLKGGLR